MSARLLLIGSAVVAATLVLAYVALGGGNYRPPETADPCEPRPFVKANAEIQGDTVIVSAPEVSDPKAVRYGWANFPVVNLTNKEGLPASPFRTDR